MVPHTVLLTKENHLKRNLRTMYKIYQVKKYCKANKFHTIALLYFVYSVIQSKSTKRFSVLANELLGQLIYTDLYTECS